MAGTLKNNLEIASKFTNKRWQLTYYRNNPDPQMVAARKIFGSYEMVARLSKVHEALADIRVATNLSLHKVLTVSQCTRNAMSQSAEDGYAQTEKNVQLTFYSPFRDSILCRCGAELVF